MWGCGRGLGRCASSAWPLFPKISLTAEKAMGWWRLLSSWHSLALTANVCKRTASCQSHGSVAGNAVQTPESRRESGVSGGVTGSSLSVLVWSKCCANHLAWSRA